MTGKTGASQENGNINSNKVPPHTCQMAKMKRTDVIKDWQRGRVAETPLPDGGVKTGETVQETVIQY